MEAKDSFSLTWCEKHKNWYQYNCPDCMVDANEADIKREGIKEVVDWVLANAIIRKPFGEVNKKADEIIVIPIRKWHTKLKEWGLEVIE